MSERFFQSSQLPLRSLLLRFAEHLLCSLKKWFKNIIVITHVDAVKDITDNLLEIVKNGKDSKITHT